MLRSYIYKMHFLHMIKKLTILLFFLSSCSYLSKATAGPAQREGLLSSRLNKFTRAMYFESISELSDYIEPVYQKTYFKNFERRGDTQDFVESKVKSLDFYSDSNKAVAFVRTKFIDKGSLYVQNKYEKLDWRFTGGNGGWKLYNLTEIEKNVFEHLNKK